MIGQSVAVVAVTKDAAGNVLTGRSVTWSGSDTALADLLPTGASVIVRTKKAGTFSLTASSEQRTAGLQLIIVPVLAATVTMNTPSLALIAGRSAQLSASPRDSAGALLVGRTITWTSSNGQIASVTAAGGVVAVAPGTATISATVDGATATAVVTVTSSAASGSWGMATEFAGPYWTSPNATQNFIAFGASGDFNGDGLTDLVVTSWTLSTNIANWSSTTRNPPAPVKIFLQKSAGGFEDATATLLGSELMAYAQEPLIADFNKDGVDDIVLAGFTDLPPLAAPGLVLISAQGKFVKRDLPSMWVHGAAVADVDRDGCLDIVIPHLTPGLFAGNCSGNFSMRTWATNGAAWVTGNAACVGDLNGDKRPELTIADAFTSRPKPHNDNVIYEFDWSAAQLSPSAIHRLPMPFWDRGNTTTQMRSHDQRCLVGDLNGDGRLDIIVSATPQAADNIAWKEESKIQVYLNRGDWQFADHSDLAFPGRSDASASSFTPALVDLNGDGKLDLLYPAESYNGVQANQVWYGAGNGSFSPAPGVDMSAMLIAARTAVKARRGAGAVPNASLLAVIPMRRKDGRYDFAIPVSWADAQSRRSIDVEVSRVGWTFP